MTEVRRFRVRNRLRAAMFDGGGKLVAEALASADKALCALSDACNATIRNKLTQIDAVYGSSVEGRAAESPRALYELILPIIDASVCDTRTGLPEACSSLCDLLDHCAEKGVWDWPCVDVHVAALHCLYVDQSMSSADRMKIVMGLSHLRQHREHSVAETEPQAP